MQISEKILEEIIVISIKICCIKKFEFESILYFISQAEKNFPDQKNRSFDQRIFDNLEKIKYFILDLNKTLSVNPCNMEENLFLSSVRNLLISQNDNSEKKINSDKDIQLKILVKETNILSFLNFEEEFTVYLIFFLLIKS